MLQPGFIQPQLSLNAVSSNFMPHSLSNDDASHASATAYYEPASISTSEPVRGYGVADQDSKTGYSAHEGDWKNRRLVFKEVSYYPSQHTVSSPLNYGANSNTAGGYSQANYMSKGSSTGCNAR